MRLAKTVLLTAVVVVLSTYAVDCSAMVTPMQMMQCCRTMHCNHHQGNQQNCCQTMSSTHSPFVKTIKIEAPAVPALLVAMVPSQVASAMMAPHADALMVISHSPPISPPITSVSPLRI